MAKMKLDLGAVQKSREAGKPDYIRLTAYNAKKLAAMLLALPPKGHLDLSLESKASQLKSHDDAVAAGKISGDWVAGKREQILATPDFVRFHVTKLVDKE